MTRKIFFLLFLLCFYETISAQNRISYTIENTKGGLASNLINCIEIDKKGIVWIGTLDGGVSRFDGTNWMNYTKENTKEGLASNKIYCISFDKEGNVWFGTRRGACRFDGTNWNTYCKKNTKNAIPDNRVLTISSDKRGRQWFGYMDEGVSVFDGKKWIRYMHTNSPIRANVYSLALDSMGNVWCATFQEIVMHDSLGWHGHYLSKYYFVTKLVIDRKERFWCEIEDDGNSYFVTNSGDSIRTIIGERTNSVLNSSLKVYSIAYDSFDTIWLGTPKGVSKFDGSKLEDFMDMNFNWSPDDWKNGRHPISLAIDSKNNKWIGTSNGILVIKEE
jgi:two-component system sensor histidine kinase ChiS